MGEPGQVADERADGASAPPPGRQHLPRRALPAHLARHLAGELEHVPVEEEEPREPELVDQAQLLVEAGASLVEQQAGTRRGVALVEGAVADARELDDRRLGVVGEVGVAVAELLREVEAEPFGELAGAGDGAAVVGEPCGRVLRREQDALVVAAPLALAAVEGAPAPDRHEHVLEQRPRRVVRVDVAGRDRRHAERLGEVAERRVPAGVAALERPLELDVEAVAAERPREARGRVRVADGEPVAGAAGQADEAGVALLQHGQVEPRGERLGALLRTGLRVRRGQQPAEVRVPLLALDEERHVRTVGERHLRARDRPYAELLRGERELERAAEPVVVGEGERLVAELGRADRELLRQRGAVEEREGRVGVQLDVRHADRTRR